MAKTPAIIHEFIEMLEKLTRRYNRDADTFEEHLINYGTAYSIYVISVSGLHRAERGGHFDVIRNFNHYKHHAERLLLNSSSELINFSKSRAGHEDMTRSFAEDLVTGTMRNWR